jgi:hypothetical protein
MPQDREVMSLLGVTAAEYRKFLEAADQLTRVEAARPGPKALIFGALFVGFIINLAIGVALTVAATLLMPRPQTKDAPRTSTKEVDGQNLVRGDSYSAKSGFGSVQNVVELGSIVPMVYARREIIDGVAYGGVRVNTNLLWSQMLSEGGNQMFRGMFLLGQGGIEEIDAQQFAIGDNLLTGYGFNVGGQLSSKIAIYANLTGGRLDSSHHVAGVDAAEDDGNFERRGASDIFQVPDENGVYRPWTCSTGRPSTQTAFGLYAPIGSCLTYRVNPSFRPATSIFLKSRDNGDNYEVKCEADAQEKVQRYKYQAAFHGRVWFPGRPDGVFTMQVGDFVDLRIDERTDGEHEFRYRVTGPDGEASCADVGQSIAGRQKGYDDAIVIGERYLLGTALVVCVERDEHQFVSDIETDPVGRGIGVSARFRVLSAGATTNQPPFNQNDSYKPVEGPRNTATNSGQLFKVAIASVVLGRKARIIEVGIRSAVGMQINGLYNFSTSWSFSEIDERYCLSYEGDVNDSDEPFKSVRFQGGVLQVPEERYSFNRLRYREAGTDNDFAECEQLFGIRSITQKPVYNYLRICFPYDADWEYQLVPVSGWEVRISNRPLEVLDFRAPEREVQGAGLRIWFTGLSVPNTQATFRSAYFENDDELGIRQVDNSNVDGWAKLAEIFMYGEISTSVQSGPEHEIVYVNIFDELDEPPEYDDLATVGINLRAGPEVQELSQVSVPVLRGLGGTHLFPEVYADMLTNPAYRAKGTLNPRQIDWPSFVEAANWNYERRYFCDLAQAEPLNRRVWGKETAANFLLDLVTRNGQIVLQPAFYLDRPEPITALFTSGNIVEDSFEYSTAELGDRLPVRVSVRWRQERESVSLGQRSLFPLIREVTVAAVGTPDDAQLVRIDLTDFGTSERHAIDVGKVRCLSPLLAQSVCRFRTWPHAGAIIPGRCFAIGLETIRYDAPANGVIAPNGAVTAWPPLADGTYDVLLWETGANVIEERQITVAGGRSSPAASVFCLRQTDAKALTYKAMSVRLNEEGEVEVEGIEFPVDAQGYSLYADRFDDESRWIIEGRV